MRFWYEITQFRRSTPLKNTVIAILQSMPPLRWIGELFRRQKELGLTGQRENIFNIRDTSDGPHIDRNAIYLSRQVPNLILLSSHCTFSLIVIRIAVSFLNCILSRMYLLLSIPQNFFKKNPF